MEGPRATAINSGATLLLVLLPLQRTDYDLRKRQRIPSKCPYGVVFRTQRHAVDAVRTSAGVRKSFAKNVAKKDDDEEEDVNVEECFSSHIERRIFRYWITFCVSAGELIECISTESALWTIFPAATPRNNS